MKFWPPSLHPAADRNVRQNTGQAGSARHPTIAPGGPRPTGHRINHRSAVIPLVVALPDPLAVSLIGSLAMATKTHSPMADNGNMFRGDPGYAVNRFAGKLLNQVQSFGQVTRPITYPGSVRVGMQAGPSSAPAFPSTGGDSGMGALALMNGSVVGWSS